MTGFVVEYGYVMTRTPRGEVRPLFLSSAKKIRESGFFYLGRKSCQGTLLIILALIGYYVNMLVYTFSMARPMKNTPAPIELGIAPLGPRLAHLRKLRGFSQEALAQEIGISRKQITDYETGRAHMNDEMVVRFALALKVSTDTLLGLKEVELPIENQSIRFTRRLRELEQLPEPRKRAIIKLIDELVRATP